MLNIIEVFEGLQGEGILSLQPVVFIRFAGCNRRCTHCDTKQSWEVSASDAIEFRLNESADVINTADTLVARYGKNVPFVLTGGEPTACDPMHMLLFVRRLNDHCIRIHVETNASKDNVPWLQWLKWITLSPKIAEGFNNQFVQEDMATSVRLAYAYRGKCEMKLVVDFNSKIDFDRTSALIDSLVQIEANVPLTVQFLHNADAINVVTIDSYVQTARQVVKSINIKPWIELLQRNNGKLTMSRFGFQMHKILGVR